MLQDEFSSDKEQVNKFSMTSKYMPTRKCMHDVACIKLTVPSDIGPNMLISGANIPIKSLLKI